ncbi:MAG: hypothetical protein ABFE07_08775, partial [Armatimonadia bacterium]
MARKARTKAQYDLLVAAYREAPAAHAAAARAAKLGDYRTAKLAWEEGWRDLELEPIRRVIEREQRIAGERVSAMAKQAEAQQLAQQREADLAPAIAKAQAEASAVETAIERRADLIRVARVGRANATAALAISTTLLQALLKRKDHYVALLSNADLTPLQAAALVKDLTSAANKAADCFEMAVRAENLVVGDPTQIVEERHSVDLMAAIHQVDEFRAALERQGTPIGLPPMLSRVGIPAGATEEDQALAAHDSDEHLSPDTTIQHDEPITEACIPVGTRAAVLAADAAGTPLFTRQPMDLDHAAEDLLPDQAPDQPAIASAPHVTKASEGLTQGSAAPMGLQHPNTTPTPDPPVPLSYVPADLRPTFPQPRLAVLPAQVAQVPPITTLPLQPSAPRMPSLPRAVVTPVCHVIHRPHLPSPARLGPPVPVSHAVGANPDATRGSPAPALARDPPPPRPSPAPGPLAP